MESKDSSNVPYRFTHGEFDITVVSDGFIALPSDIIMPEASAQDKRAILARLGGGRTTAPMYTNIPVIRTGKEIVIVDTGSGSQFQDTAGALEENLKRADIDPASVTKVILTHAHPDHMGGILRDDGSLLFANAEHLVNVDEWSFWQDDALLAEGLRPFAAGARSNFAAIGERLTMVAPGTATINGIEIVSTPGHTGGHISLSLEGGDGLLITGDALTNPVVSFEHPDWRFGFDADHDTAVRTRRMLLDRFARSSTKLLGYHWSYPGIGQVERFGEAYSLV
jgi:glyoxylase-like metal-dependent hydrolase (beta-lactamase superfamily II)